MDIKLILLLISITLIILGYVNQNKYNCSQKEDIKNINIMNPGLYSIFNSNMYSDGKKSKYDPPGTSKIMKFTPIGMKATPMGRKVNLTESDGKISVNYIK